MTTHPTATHTSTTSATVSSSAIVTGSAVGIGRAICLAFAKQGMRVAGLDVDATNNNETKRLVESLGQSFLAVTCDVGDKHAVRSAVADVVADFESIDVLVNNAGYFDNSALTEGDFESQTEAFDRAMGASATGSYYVTRACVEHMPPGSNIVGMITDHVKPEFYLSATQAVGYDCAKFAMWRQTEAWAAELAPKGIRVNGLCFGAVDTNMLRNVTLALQDTAMRPEDLGQAVLNILAHGPEGPTGETWLVAKSREPRETGLREIALLAPH